MSGGPLPTRVVSAVGAALLATLALSCRPLAESPAEASPPSDGGAPAAATVTGCKLPKGTGDGNDCPRTPPGVFEEAVTAAIHRVITKHPEYFDDATAPLPHLVDPTSYLHAVPEELQAAGYCAIFDGEEIAVKNDNAFSEQYHVWFSSGYVRWGDDAYRATCVPAWF
jgi:hypothetical protein